MGQKKSVPQPPPPPPKTVKEMVKEFTRSINRLRRDFSREIMKLEANQRKIKQDMENLIKKKEPRATVRILAQQLIKTQGMITKYKRLDAQLGDVQFQLNTAATTETLVSIMKGMGQVMKAGNDAIDVKNVQMAIEIFNQECEKQNIMQEQIQDIMSQDEDDMGDEACDKLIDQMEKNVGGGSGGQICIIPGQQQDNQGQDDFENRLNVLKFN
ncbi:hypothetical protein ABPG72_010296 [Tetrahymena utriculariae]